MTDYLNPILMGLLEGITEFLPISSTGHLILAEHLLAWQGVPGKVFEVVIQLGAILAICVLYFRRLLGVCVRLPADRGARNFVAVILIAFLPAAVIGAALHHYIEQTLFNPWVVSVALVLGGIAMIAIERFFDPIDRFTEIEKFTPMLALKIGAVQLLALIPGVSRSGATIMGATLLGVSRQAAAEFSFFLAIPVMVGASAFSLYKGGAALSGTDWDVIAVGFVTAFIAALVVVDQFVKFVTRHGFSVFGWYRIAVGGVMLAYLAIA